jgi:lysophospholipase L1-like esterase
MLNQRGFDVAILDNSVKAESLGPDSALVRALTICRHPKNWHSSPGTSGNQLGIIGFASGGKLAARVVQRLNDQEQPDELILLSPVGMNETMTGTVIPAVRPPVKPTARLLMMVSAGAPTAEATASMEYAKTWKGYEGPADIQVSDDKGAIQNTLDSFLMAGPVISGSSAGNPVAGSDSKSSVNAGINPAAVAVAGSAGERHAEKLERVRKEKFDLLMIGNSITNNFDKPEYQGVWQQFFAPRKALNLGYSGYRTENILWNLQNGELDGQSPKVAILEIGTNNVDEKHYPTRHTAGQLAGGITAIVTLLRQKLPNTKIILLRCFPGCYGGPNPTSHRAILERASDIVSRLADGQHIFYCDVNHVFLNLDGSINHTLMPDWLHPDPAGAKAWAQAMEPLLSRLMGDSSLDTDIPANTAVVPVSKLEEDGYNWWARHAEALRIKDSINPEIVLIGNSITHFWGGYPALKDASGQPRKSNGPQSWTGLFGPYRVLNLGFGWDRTQNALWRLDNGELDGLHPRVVVIDIGTNNTSQTDHARMNTAPEIVEGIKAVCGRVRSKTPGAKIVLMAIFPREQSPLNPRRLLINEINRQLAAFAKDNELTFVDIGPRFLAADGTILPGLTSDWTHPTDSGYQIWADAIRSYITAP